MLTLLLTATLALPQEPEKAPSPEQVKATLEDLEQAFEEKDIAPRVAAVQRASAVVDELIVEALVDKALGDEAHEVRAAAVSALGLMRHPSALDQLHRYAKKERRALKDDPELLTSVLKSIARHGDPRSIALLADDALGYRQPGVARACILGLANIRHKDSVEALFAIMKSAARQRIQPHMQDFNLALAVLTGVEQGRSQDLWIAWWNDNKKTLEVRPEPPKLPKELQTRWDRYWGKPRTYDRQERRGDRGGGDG